jgi:hypothetical protein
MIRVALALLPFDIFFALLVALTLVDAWSTYKGLKSGAAEANPIVRRLIKALGVKEALTLIKAGYLYLVWTSPPATPAEQWVPLAIYAAVAINNLRVLRKQGVI